MARREVNASNGVSIIAMTIERTRAGLDVARKLGRSRRHKRQMTDSEIESAKKLLSGGIPLRDVAENLSVSIPTLYRWVPAGEVTTGP
jgi:DNA invertase Pin-like site-specific DNA recombinase